MILKIIAPSLLGFIIGIVPLIIGILFIDRGGILGLFFGWGILVGMLLGLIVGLLFLDNNNKEIWEKRDLI
ncbi:MAG: hypothetical protein GF308_10950 [Candidatus Heimdallarchaeota archaeon]|nr:hypothetical protein [Candidatus Heimdallarchaeota archaeon]